MIKERVDVPGLSFYEASLHLSRTSILSGRPTPKPCGKNARGY